ncbi:MAG: monofunctional biosynthetic peptidoglycan transglycosylase [Gemmatimonadota bacterium]
MAKAARPGKGKRARFRWRVGPRAWLRRLLIVAVVLLLAPVPVILLCAVVNPPTTSVMLQRTVSRAWNGKRPVFPRHTPVAHSALSPNLHRAVLASEDDRFYLHHGVDMVELRKAVARRRAGGSLRGASTLSQQVAKNIFLWNGRSFVRKGLELYLAFLLELLLSKERILDLYLNLAEWGDGVFGAEAAARTHFGKSAASLTRDEAARLAAVLPSPVRWKPRGAVATRRAATILARMRYAAPKPPP